MPDHDCTLYIQTILGGIRPLLSPARQNGNVSLPGGSRTSTYKILIVANASLKILAHARYPPD